MTAELLNKIEAYATKILTNDLPDTFVFHNLTHTQEVVAACKELAIASGVSSEESLIVEAAAWFHDLGYIRSTTDHETFSCEYAREFLENENVDDSIIRQVEACIMATKMPQKPTTLLEEIICDADLNKLAKKGFYKRGLLLQQEWKDLEIVSPDKTDNWIEYTLEFLKEHHFHTAVAKRDWAKKKQKNVIRLKEKLEELNLPKPKKMGRGVETMFRTTSRNHIQLSAIADNKANLMLSINAIIISVVISVLVPNLASDKTLAIPTVILLSVCVISVIFATISTIPKVTQGTFTKQDIMDKKANLLFFGNFHSVPLEDFEWGIKELMDDEDYLYNSMAKDLYFLGKVLDRKYKYLRICYRVFMFGLIVSVISFVGAFLAA